MSEPEPQREIRIWLPRTLLRWLRVVAKRQKVSQSAIISKALGEFLALRGFPVKNLREQDKELQISSRKEV